MDCSLPGSSVHSIFQVRTLEWVAISSPRGSSHPRDQTRVPCGSCNAGGFFIAEAPGEAQTECTPQNAFVETRPSHLVMVFEGGAPLMSSMPLKTSGANLLPCVFVPVWDYSESSVCSLAPAPTRIQTCYNLLTDFPLLCP